MNWIETDFLVLRKVQHTGNNLIVTGISPDYGQIAFYVRKQGREKAKFSSFDLFRKLSVGYYETDKELQSCTTAEVLSDYGGSSRDYWRFCAACALAKFSLRYVMPAERCPAFFRSVEVALYRLAVMNLPVEAVLTGAAVVFLKEAGWLAQQNFAAEDLSQVNLLMHMAMGEDIPALTPENWRALWQWSRAVLARQECFFPDFPEKTARCAENAEKSAAPPAEENGEAE